MWGGRQGWRGVSSEPTVTHPQAGGHGAGATGQRVREGRQGGGGSDPGTVYWESQREHSPKERWGAEEKTGRRPCGSSFASSFI